ncbi:glucokinase [Luteimonas notoginsengisoli]|uniref:Glucokinase n=1 Tax=Luteimonas notoginsengisoli TaxID=1578200 RepID=A0ABV7UUC0_9GAMM
MSRVFLAADIGGTHARLALVEPRGGDRIAVVHRSQGLCAAHGSLAQVVSALLPQASRVEAAAIAVAGVVQGGRVISRNLPWPVDADGLRALGIPRVAVVNDFVAAAHAVQCMEAADTTLLTPRAGAAADGPVLVVGPGTGLGAALRVPVAGGVAVLPCEPQQMSFAPGNARELALLRQWMEAGTGHVGIGHAVSGPGLLCLYRGLCALDGVAPVLGSPLDVAAAADGNGDAHAAEAVSRFCGLFGSLVGDLAMATGASAVFVIGGVAASLKRRLLESDFAARLVDKDLMCPVLERIPVRLVEDPDVGVIGAACWYLQQAARAQGA